MRLRLTPNLVLAAATAALALVPTRAAAQGARTCTWGGTPAAPTGVSVSDPLTNLPSAEPLRFSATGVLAGDCRGTFTFTGLMGAGSSCGAISFEGIARGLPGVRRFAGQSVAGVAPARLYDRHGNVVGSENAQFLTNSNFTDCSTPAGLTRVQFSSVIELW